MNRQKRILVSEIQALFTFSQWQTNMSEDYTKVENCNTQVAGKIEIKISEYISTHVLPCTHHHMVITTYEERNFNEVI